MAIGRSCSTTSKFPPHGFGPDGGSRGRIGQGARQRQLRNSRESTFLQASSRGVLMAGLVPSENTCFPTGSQGLLELPI